MLAQQPLGNELLLLQSLRAQAPPSRICVSLHDDSLDLCNDAVIARGHGCCCHLRNTNGNSLSLCGHDHNLLVDFYTVLETEQTRNHQFCTITYSIDGRILQNQALVVGQQRLQRHNHTSKVFFILVIIMHPLSIQYIMHCHHIILLSQDSRTDTAKLLHVSSHSKQQTQMDTQRPHICSSLTRNPKDCQVALVVVFVQLCLVNSSDTELPLHS
mmetsp:Transcript_607/g.1412  ORF Transcript_607/g.1412 Transcript_607/m.1412 type:complete len:214 (-) Transcript_607:670-1311(-)